MRSALTQLILSSVMMTQSSFALTPNAKALVFFETRSNAAAIRSNESLMIPHFEIPLDLLEVNFADRFSENIQKHLIFERDGVKFVRWILNPEDTKWHHEVAAHFKAKGLELEKKYYFKGYQTASRSYIVEDPNQEIQFSVKSSTNKTGGSWRDKKQPVGEAVDSRLNADLIDMIQKKLKFQNIIIMDEPAILKLSAIDQAVVIRDLAELNNPNSDKIYVPGFSVLHETTGLEIAKRNGSNDPYAFWTEHYIKPVGRALGEFAARTGMQFDSPHSQNFLVEFDSQLKPTGRIVFRDLADLYINKKFVKVLLSEAQTYLKFFSQKENITTDIQAGFGPLHGNEAPLWISQKEYNRWKNIFFKHFELSFHEHSGLPIPAFKTTEGYINGKYFSNAYELSKERGVTTDFWKNMRKYQNPLGKLNCSFVFLTN
ncbi:MAG: hypothetical protein BroJett040_10620 [Oligoflexia bacterium]|nr:MAG: hypothetical protein BroJett040_10620 [Oligoflexia bacterium]